MKPNVVIVDHFDSFTYNLAVAFEILGASVRVLKTSANVREIRKIKPTHVVLSPGPGHPKDVPLFQEVIAQFKGRTPILGVCLGHQAIGLYFGAEIVRSPTIMHGKVSEIKHSNEGIFACMPNPFRACRYHSLMVRVNSLLEVTAASQDGGIVMGIRGMVYPNVIGVQFHPESFFSESGLKLLSNFLRL